MEKYVTPSMELVDIANDNVILTSGFISGMSVTYQDSAGNTYTTSIGGDN